MTQTFEEFLSTSRANIPIFGFIINIILSVLLAVILNWIYVKYGNSLSNRKLFAKNFLIITMTTMLIITIVKSSLALSLGLVGALSIIRFRAAIKEPEELAYLFLAIGIGLGCGADQSFITLIAFIIIAIVIVTAKTISRKSFENQNLHLIIHSKKSQKLEIETIIEILKNYCDAVDLKRFDEDPEVIEASFLVESQNFTQLQQAKEALQNIDANLKITFLDNRGII